MTETEYNIIIKIFEGESLDFIEDEQGKIGITSEAIAKGLEINKYNILQIYGAHKSLLERHSTNMKIISVDNKRREVRVFDKTATIWICVRSNSPKALPFQEWVIDVIDSVVNKGYYNETEIEGSTDIDLYIKQSEMNTKISKMITKAFITIKEQTEKLNLLENKVEGVGTELKQFEQKYEDEKKIDPSTMAKIQEIVHLTHLKTGIHWGTLYGAIRKEFKIANIKNITEKLAQKILTWLEQNPAFYKPTKEEGDLPNEF